MSFQFEEGQASRLVAFSWNKISIGTLLFLSFLSEIGACSVPYCFKIRQSFFTRTFSARSKWFFLGEAERWFVSLCILWYLTLRDVCHKQCFGSSDLYLKKSIRAHTSPTTHNIVHCGKPDTYSYGLWAHRNIFNRVVLTYQFMVNASAIESHVWSHAKHKS